MSPERWKLVEEAVAKAQELSPEQREAYLQEACGSDGESRGEVERLLAAWKQADGFLATPSSSARGARPPMAMDPEQPTTIGPYRVLRPIAAGGMGLIYLGERDDPEFRHPVAIKMVGAGVHGAGFARRFRNERRILAHLDHPNIARLFDGGTNSDGRPYFVMEHIVGTPIDSYCDRERLTIPERIELFLRVCDAVQYAHQSLVVHRDLKPSNILVNEEGIPKLLDFGIGKVLEPEAVPFTVERTGTGSGPMTPGFASPEQIRGEVVTTSTDIYSLGVLLYRLMTGEGPYRTGSGRPHEVERAILEQEPIRPSDAVEPAGARIGPARSTSLRGRQSQLRGDLDNIVLMALRKEPAERYRSARELAEDLRRHLGRQPVLARPATWRYRVGRFVQRNAWAVAVGVAASIVILAFSVVTAIQSSRIAAERDLALQERAKAQQVSDLVMEIFEEADPFGEGGETITVREVLDHGAERIKDLEDQPELQAAYLVAMGKAYRGLASFDQAAPLFEESIKIRRRVHGEIHAGVAEGLHELATVEIETGEFSRAEEHLRQVIAILRRLESEPSLAYAAAVNDLGVALSTQLELETSESLYREALEIRRAKLGNDHPDVSESLTGLAAVFHYRSEFERAEPLFREILAIDRRHYGERHPIVAESIHNLASVLHYRGRYAESERLFREALEMRRSLLGDDHPMVAGVLNNLGLLLYDMSRFGEAGENYRSALRIYRSSLGGDHPFTSTTIHNLGLLEMALGRLDLAEDLLAEALEGRRLQGEDHPTVGQSFVAFAALRLKQGAFAEGEEFARRSLEVFTRQSVDELWVAHARVLLGACLSESGRFSEAEPLLVESFPVIREKSGEGSGRARRAARDLARHYALRGMDKEAEAYRSLADEA